MVLTHDGVNPWWMVTWFTRPERPKHAKDDVKRSDGPPTRSWHRGAPTLLVLKKNSISDSIGFLSTLCLYFCSTAFLFLTRFSMTWMLGPWTYPVLTLYEHYVIRWTTDPIGLFLETFDGIICCSTIGFLRIRSNICWKLKINICPFLEKCEKEKLLHCDF